MVEPDNIILEKTSYLTLWHENLADFALYPEHAHLCDPAVIAKTWEHREAMLSQLTPSAKAYYHSFLCELPPPNRRYNDSRALKRAFSILRQARWNPPRQGVILRCPANHWRLPEGRWLVVSNTHFNRRYPLPIFAYVPMLPPTEMGLSVQECAAEGRLIRHLGGKPFVAVEEMFRTFDISQEWFNKCARCYHRKRYPHSWLIGPENNGTCVFCDNAVAQWPEEVDVVPKNDLSLVLRRVLAYLKAEPPFGEK